MDSLYEYLIGGKKTGSSRELPKFNELEVGDEFYVYYYMEMKKPTYTNDVTQDYYYKATVLDLMNNGKGLVWCYNQDNNPMYLDIKSESELYNKSCYIFKHKVDNLEIKFGYATTLEELQEHYSFLKRRKLDDDFIEKYNKDYEKMGSNTRYKLKK